MLSLPIILALALIVPPVDVPRPVPIDSRCKYTDLSMIPRDASNHIIRSTSARAQFLRANPCPSTGLRFGACPRWFVDHVCPLAVGCIDAPINMQWLPGSIKSCPKASGVQCKDQFEQQIYTCSQ